VPVSSIHAEKRMPITSSLPEKILRNSLRSIIWVTKEVKPRVRIERVNIFLEETGIKEMLNVKC
jgi:hypothetical protein